MIRPLTILASGLAATLLAPPTSTGDSVGPEGPAPPPAPPTRPEGPRALTGPVPPAPDVSDAPLDFADDAAPSQIGLSRSAEGNFDYVDPGGRFAATIHEDGTITFRDPWRRESRTHPDRGEAGGLPIAGLPGLNPLAGLAMNGPTEWAMLARGIDPSRTAKSKLLERTHELRTQMAVAWARARIDERLDALDTELLVLWSDHTLDRARRRELLFERWDECDERFAVAPAGIPDAAVSAIDQYRLDAASTARAKIIGFVRRHVPRTSRHRFTHAELERFNARRVSREPFAPYGH